MEAEQTIERIKKIEEEGKRKIAEAEAKKEAILKNAREKAVLLAADFEKTKEAGLKEKTEAAQKEAQKESAKILAKAGKDAEEIRKRASEKTGEISSRLFDNFRKNLLL